MEIMDDGIVIFSDSESQHYTKEMIQNIIDDYRNKRGEYVDGSPLRIWIDAQKAKLTHYGYDAIHPDVSPENFDRIRKSINNLND